MGDTIKAQFDRETRRLIERTKKVHGYKPGGLFKPVGGMSPKIELPKTTGKVYNPNIVRALERIKNRLKTTTSGLVALIPKEVKIVPDFTTDLDKSPLLEHHCSTGCCSVRNPEGPRGLAGTLYGNCGCPCMLCAKEGYGPITSEAVSIALSNIVGLADDGDFMAAAGWEQDLHVKLLKAAAHNVVIHPRVCMAIAANTDKLGLPYKIGAAGPG